MSSIIVFLIDMSSLFFILQLMKEAPLNIRNNRVSTFYVLLLTRTTSEASCKSSNFRIVFYLLNQSQCHDVESCHGERDAKMMMSRC